MLKKLKVIFGLLGIFAFLTGGAFAQSEALRKAETLILKDAYSEAAQECRKLLTHHHQENLRAKTYYLLGLSLLKENKFSQARENFSIVLEKFRRSKSCDHAALGIADSYLLAGEFAQAQSSYVQFMRDFPRSPLVNLARTHLEQCKQGTHFNNAYFSVQVGCFSSQQNAEKLRDELISAGFQAYMLQLSGDQLFRVRVGRLSNRGQAEFLEQRLKAEGYQTKVCP